jgi:predicted porin
MKKLPVVLFICFFPFLLKAQETGPSPQGQKDFQLWLDAGLNYKVNKKFDLSFEAAYRRDNNLADVSQTYLELQAKSDPLKFLVISGGYRLSGWFEKYLVNRLFAYARFSFDIERLKVQYRLRYDNNFNASIGELPDFLRNKIKLKYRIRKFPIDPYFAYELFYRTNYIDPKFTQQRFDIGLDYAISKKNSLQVYYRFQQELNAYAPERNFILGISYSFDL